MKPIERYLAATSGKNNKNNSDHDSAAGSHEAVLVKNDSLSRNLGKVAQISPNRRKKNVLEITSHAVAGGNRMSTTSFSRAGGDFCCDMSIYDEVTIAEETVMEEEVIEEIEEEIMEEEEEVIEEDEAYAWGVSAHTNSQRSRLSKRFPSRSFQKQMDGSASTRSSTVYDEDTVVSESAGSRMSKMSFYDEVTVTERDDDETEEHTVIDGDLDDIGDGGDDDDGSGHNSDLDSDDGVPDEDKKEEEEECDEGEGGFTLAFSNQARVSDITLDHSSWVHDMGHEFDDDDEHHVPGQGEEGYCSQFKEGNFRSSLVSHPAPPTKKFPSPSLNKFVPSNKFAAAPKAPTMKTSTFVHKMASPPTAMKSSPFIPRANASFVPSITAPRVSIMQQFANKPLPAVTEASARKERGEKKKNKPKSFETAGEKKELFLFWERKSMVS